MPLHIARLSISILLAGLLSSVVAQDSIPYLTRRARFETKLTRHGRSPGNAKDPKVLDGYQPVTYQSGKLRLKAWVYVPPGTTSRSPRAAIVHFHGGFGVSLGHFATCKPFVRKGFIVMLPSMRAENGNPGDYELWFGEVDDAVAAVKWLHRQRIVDKKRLYVFGHSSGGVISSVLSLMDDLPIQHSGGCGGLYDVNTFPLLTDRVPFDMSNPMEMQLRVLPGNIRWMKRKHYAYYGDEDQSVARGIANAKAEIAGKKSLLEMTMVPGDHYKSLTPAMEEYMKVIASERSRR